MEISELKANEIQFLGELQPEGWSDIISVFEYYSKTDFCLPFKAVIKNKIVGIGAVIFHHEVAWLGHVIVHPEYRKKGIGTFITQLLINEANDKNCETIYLVATDLGVIIYEKLGFITEAEYLFYYGLKQQQNWLTSGNIIPYTHDWKEQITRMDKEVSSEDRLCTLQNHLENGFVYKQDQLLEGYYLPTLGEGLIIANNYTAGIELMKFRLQSKNNAIFPATNLYATEFMNKNKFKISRKGTRMRLGKKRKVLLSNVYNRVAGNNG